jgi:hypothetical protein
VAAVVAGGWAAITSYVPIMLVAGIVAFGPGVSLGGVARLAAGAWLVAQGVPVQAGGDRVSLAPLAITVLVGWRLVRAGVHASRVAGGQRSVARAVGAGGTVALAYALIGVVVAVLAAGGGLTVSPLRTGLVLGGLAAVSATLGAVSHSRARHRLLARVPMVLRAAARTAVASVLVVLGAGAAAGGVALALHGGDAADLLGGLRAGVLGQAGITVLCLAYAPNAAVWGAAYLIGPGFAVGTGTVVSPGLVLLGPVPGVPLLAGLPTSALSGAGPALLGVPVLAGAAAGWLVGRRGELRVGRRVGAAALGGVLGGLLLQGLAYASAGALGSGRLMDIGPAGWRVGLFAAVVLAVGASVGALLSLLGRDRRA